MDAIGRACARIVEAPWFQGAVVVAISGNAVLLGLETYDTLEADFAGLLGHPLVIEERLGELRDALDGLEAELARESGGSR